MDGRFKVSLLLLAILGTSLSLTVLAQAVDPQPFVPPPPGESIKSIALLKIPEPQFGYFLGEGGSGPGGMAFGLRGLLQGWTRPHHPEYAGFQFGAVAEHLLTEHLTAAGFNVITVPVERKKRNQLLRNYEALSVPNVDAYLDIATLGVGYRQSRNPYATAETVGPYLCVVVRLVSARSKRILYADTIQYGWRKAKIGIDGTDIDAPEQHVFENAKSAGDALMSGEQGRGIAWLSQGIDVAMRTIVSAFSSYPAMGLPQQAGSRPRTNSPIEVSKAAPASTASPGTTIPKDASSKRYKIGIFPAAGNFGMENRGTQENQSADIIRATISQNSALDLRYSAYHSGLNMPQISQGSVWDYKGNRQEPKISTIRKLAKERNLDAVVLARGDTPGGWGFGGGLEDPGNPVSLYMVNIATGELFKRKGTFADVGRMAEQLLAGFLATHPTVVATAPTQHAEVATSQSASTGSHFEGITLQPGGSVKAINAAADAYCGSLNKKSKLVAAPPNHPNYVFQCYQPTKAASTPAAHTTVAKATPDVQRGTVSGSYKIGIFPAAGDFSRNGAGTPWDEDYTAHVLANHLRADASHLSLAYSSYDPSLNQPPIYDYTKVWAGTKPKLPAIYREAEARHLDAVFTYRGTGWWRGYGSAPSDPMPIELYLIDVKHRRTYAQKGDTDRLEKMEDELISRLVQFSSGAPAQTPTSVAITGWRQKPVTDLQSIIGKWEGFVLTAKGKKFDLEITYRDDGSYTFRAGRGTTRTASAMQIVDGVLKGKSYTTGDPVTVILYEDEDGNHVLKARRADGLTWTVARSEHALTKFLLADQVRRPAVKSAQLPATRRWPPEQVIEGPKASITASSLKGWRATIGVFTDRDGCPDVPIDAQFFKQTEKTFDVPAGNKIDIVFKESQHLFPSGEKYCMGAFRFSPKDAAQYNLRLASKIGISMLLKSSCHYSFSVTDGDREKDVESYFPFKVIQGFGCTGLSCTEQSFKLKEFGPLIESICAK